MNKPRKLVVVRRKNPHNINRGDGPQQQQNKSQNKENIENDASRSTNTTNSNKA